MKSVLQKLQFVLLLLPIAAMSQWTQLGQTLYGPEGSEGATTSTWFGTTSAVSANGTVMAIGSLSVDEYHTQVFGLVSGEWVQIGSDIDGTQFPTGWFSADYPALGLSADGNILAIGESQVDSGGRVRVFQNINDEWVQIGSDIFEENLPSFGYKLSLSPDGNTIAAASLLAFPDDPMWSGMVKVFQNVSGNWVQKGNMLQSMEFFGGLGGFMSMSADGNRLALSQYIGFVPTVAVYDYDNLEWQKTSEDIEGGYIVSLSADGTKLAIGEPEYSSSLNSSGRVKLYGLSGDNDWVEETILESYNPVSNGKFGQTVSMSANADVIAIGTGNSLGTLYMYQNTVDGWELTGEFLSEEQALGKNIFPVLSANGSVVLSGKRLVISVGSTSVIISSVAVYKNCDLTEVPQIENTDFTEGDTLADLDVTAEGTLTWYADEDLTIVLEEDTPLVNETTYYVTQTDLTGCTSEAVAVTVSTDPCFNFLQPEGNANQTFTQGQTLADLDVTGVGLTWYAEETLDTVLEDTTVLIHQTTYYVVSTNEYCQSEALAVFVEEELSNTAFDKYTFSYYPNPVKDVLHFATGENRVQAVQIYDLNGKLVFDQQSAQGINQIGLAVLPQATYVVKVQTERNVHTFKLVKE